MSQLKILKIKDYKDFYQFSYYNRSLNKKSKTVVTTSKKNTEESLRCSISRSIALIKDYVFSNDFEYFFTLTLKSKKRNSVPVAFRIINSAIKSYARKAGNDFKYIFVFEKQKKGGLHIHGFFSGFYDLYINKYGHLSSYFFDDIGFQNFTKVEKVNPFYLIKYISKEPIKELKHRFYRSKNLKKAEVSILHCNFDELQKFNFTYQNSYCKMVSIDK